MKKILTLLFVWIPFLTTLAQDKIITVEGDVLIGYNIEIGQSTIFFQIAEDKSSPIERIEKKNVLMIRKQDGTKTYISDMSQPTEPIAVEEMTTNQVDKELNDNIRQRYNVELIPCENEDKGKRAKVAFCQLWATEDSQFADANIEIEYQTMFVDYDYGTSKKTLSPYLSRFNNIASNVQYPQINITVHNRSNKTVYIDLGNTFFIRAKESTAFYQPSNTSVTTGSSIGGSLNLGAVTNALGVGGFVGDISNGVSVGKNNNKSTTTTTYAQRIIALPPLSSKALTNQQFCPTDYKIKIGDNYEYELFGYKYTKFWQSDLGIKSAHKMLVSEEIHLQAEASPTFEFFISYSLDEQFTNAESIHTKFYVKKIVGEKGGYFYKMNLR